MADHPHPLPSQDHPVLCLIDELLSIETDDMRWLRENGPIARRLNEEARHD